MIPMDYLYALAGGVLIGLSASLLLLSRSRTVGISGMLGGLVSGSWPALWRTSFLVGLALTGLVMSWVWPAAFTNTVERSPAALVLAGLCVGLGTRMGNGCTSGHGVCGISRGSRRSIVATITFIGVGALTVTVIRVAFGGVV